MLLQQSVGFMSLKGDSTEIGSDVLNCQLFWCNQLDSFSVVMSKVLVMYFVIIQNFVFN
jgi:hypothetical protein